MQSLLKLSLLLVALVGLVFYYNVSLAQRVALYDTIPSETDFHQLQYCLEDADCQIVRWRDCNQCQYARSLNYRFAEYFYDNADYYNYPIGFNKHYCDALSQIEATSGKKISANFKVSCEDQVPPEEVVSSKCDQLIKQCYSICHDGLGREKKCVFDTYSNKIYEDYINPWVDVKTNEK